MPLDPVLIGSTQVLLGLVLLIWSADRFITSAAAIAQRLNISPLIVGLIIVGFGTSAPEMMVSAVSTIQAKPAIAIGNALGSNITNIALVLGLSALLKPIMVKSQIIRREIPLLLLVTGSTAALLFDETLSRLDGCLLLFGLITILWWMIRIVSWQRNSSTDTDIETGAVQQEAHTLLHTLLWLSISIIILLLSSQTLVQGAVSMAQFFGISELIIGLTIIAIGTSLPELAASLVATFKNHHELSLGNIIGSNIFNLLGVLAIPGLIRPGALPADVLSRDLPLVVILTFALFIMAYSFGKTTGRINRFEGGLLLASFIVYQIRLFRDITATV